MANVILVPGDILKRWKDGVWHLGIYWGNGLVLHNSPPAGEHLSQLQEFSSDHEIVVTQPFPETRQEILQRASGVLSDPKKYSYLWRNCEHTFYQIIEGAPRSPTVQQSIAWLAAIGFGVLAIRYRKEITQALKA
jgi:hypothetical protein